MGDLIDTPNTQPSWLQDLCAAAPNRTQPLGLRVVNPNIVHLNDKTAPAQEQPKSASTGTPSLLQHLTATLPTTDGRDVSHGVLLQQFLLHDSCT